MAKYPYLCSKCDTRFEVDKPMSESGRPESCPECETVIAEQTYAGRRLNGFVSTDSN